MAKLINLSASKIKKYLECKNQYYLRYIVFEPDQKNLYAVLGLAFHKAIELYYTSGSDPYRTFEETWHKEREAAQLMHDNGLFYDGYDMLELYPFDGRRPTSLELPFALPFPSADAPLCIIRGYIDQHYEEARMVWDLKTAKRKPSGPKLNTDPQFILYSWACEQLFGYQPTLVWYHARTGEQLVADVHDREKLDTVIAVVQDILAFHANPQFEAMAKTCFFCPNPMRCREGAVRVGVHS